MRINRTYALWGFLLAIQLSLGFCANIYPSSTPTSTDTPSTTNQTRAPSSTLTAEISSPNGQYFVALSGSDDNPGTRDRPFRTIQKCADIAKPGQACLIRAGIYRETVRPAVSGTQAAPITFAPYNNEDVTISGTDPVLGWSPFRDSIFRTKVALPVNGYSDTGFFANQLFANGEMMPEARWPNLGGDLLRPTLASCCTTDGGGTKIDLENKDLPDLPGGLVGATIWTNEWYVTRTGTVTSSSPGRLSAEMSAPWERGGFWFYLAGKLNLLDSEGEWYYDGNEQFLYFWLPGGTLPESIEAKQRNFAFDLSDRSHIVVQNLKLFGNTITTSDASQGIVIDGIRAKYISHHMTLPPLPKSEQAPNSDDNLVLASHAHDTGIQLRGSGHTLKNSILEWSSGNGVLLEGIGHTVTNNVIANSNYLVSFAAPVRVNGTQHKITHNTIERAGRDAIAIDWHTAGFEGRNLEIAYNDISSYGMLSTDLGALYICCYINLEGGSIHHNSIRDTQAFSQFWGTRGIYLDIESYNSTIHHNAVWNITGGKDSYYVVAGSPRGSDRVFNNTFLGPIIIGESVQLRNNIYGEPSIINTKQQSNNLNLGKDPRLNADLTLPPGSPAIDKGISISGFTDDFVGKAPDIGAYESGEPRWQAGANLQR
ncbi:right-handed parallel beta-helix repeat-containing protein [Hydrococcus rivularis]|uniref:right-handed parallel beta-helix repeat-containing protein n=1 Tax=Hydrococcus rivularis TaxID=1616834 RepID=UPI0015881E8E|nr:right-handed parallel beta-helix repeat-containing protein [Hydrococcus rivularis]